MSKYLGRNFYLSNSNAIYLYNNFAEKQPIFDYHCHLKPQEIAEDKHWKNITELWLGGDHYKWRLMRANGVSEELITGKASDFEKFKAFAATLPYCLGNPVYQWSHLELKTYFGINTILNEKTAKLVWEKANSVINREDFSAKNLIRKSNVKVIFTTDDPVDSLEYHAKIKKDKSFDTTVLPAFRPDKGLAVESLDFLKWLEKLEKSSGKKIRNFEDYLEAFTGRIQYFNKQGCRASDHALNEVFYCHAGKEEVDHVFEKVLKGLKISHVELEKFKTFLLVFLSEKYSKLGWVMQLHIGAQRNINKKMFETLGSDSCFDAINDVNLSKKLAQLLNEMEIGGNLPKTVLYNLNPSDNETLAVLAGSFQGQGSAMKIQFGPGWWFNDHYEGMLRQMTALANTGLLRRFIGMTTDSRSFLSYTRHDYFRRVLCNLLGSWAERGDIPNDLDLLGKMVSEICYENAVNYFNIE